MAESSFIQLAALNFPEKYQIRLKREQNMLYIFCSIRKKWLKWTPEEWVRQHMVLYLIENKLYKASSINVEVPLDIYGLSQRADIIVYKKEKANILVECKASHISLNQEVLNQTLRYCQILKPEYAVLTNGIQFMNAKIYYENKRIEFIDELPSFK